MTDDSERDLWPSVQYRYETQYKQAGVEHMPVQLAWTDLPWLMREVERLRTENAAMREIVQAVADGEAQWFDEMGMHCAFCDQIFDPQVHDRVSHANGCIVPKARALIGEVPA